MSNPYFHFKQFTVYHHLCAMKVGTDGVLLGAWSPINGTEERILDIGTGSGLIALMLAQRSTQATILGIDIEENSIKQAQQNFNSSKWANRLNAQLIDVQTFARTKTEEFDLIVSNPPFFNNSVRNPQKSRATARHTDTLSYEELFLSASKLLSKKGVFSCILPASEESQIIKIAAENGLFLCRKTYVIPKPSAQVKRILMAFTKSDNIHDESTITLENDCAQRSLEYQKLTADFYL